MTEKYIMCSLEDEKSVTLGEAISNPTCKKIINLLSEKDMSASEISQSLKIPLNTLDYNLKKLIDAGIIEKSKHFWSVKGKKIPTYKVVNKVIVIQPKKTSNVYSKLKGIVPVVVFAALGTLLIAFFDKIKNLFFAGDELAVESMKEATLSVTTTTSPSAVSTFMSSFTWLWFALGALIVLALFLIWNWKKL